MMTPSDILGALVELHRREKTQTALAKLAGITQSTISAYLNNRAKIENMPLGVFLRLFRCMKIDFFNEAGKKAACDNYLQEELLKIFNSLDEKGKIHMLAVSAAEFGQKLRLETSPSQASIENKEVKNSEPEKLTIAGLKQWNGTFFSPK